MSLSTRSSVHSDHGQGDNRLKKTTFKTEASPDELYYEIDQLHSEVEKKDNRLRAATEEIEWWKNKVADQEEGSNRQDRRSPVQRAIDSDMATEAEVRWGIFLTEKARLQSEKGWRKALKESKKLLEERLEESAAQHRARDREMAGLKARLSSDAEEESKRKKEVDGLRAKIDQLQEYLDSERQLRVQEQDKYAQLEEEFCALHHVQESHKMVDGRSKQRLVTNDLASQLSFHNEDFEEYDREHRLSDRLDALHEKEDDKVRKNSSIHLRTPLSRVPSHELCETMRKSIFLQREDDLNRCLQSSEAARCELEAQVVELQHQLQMLDHNTRSKQSPPAEDQELCSRLHDSEAARRALEAERADLQSQLQHLKHKAHSTVSPQVPEPEFSGANNELWEECEEMRNVLNKVTQEKDDAKWEAKEAQRRLFASEAQRRELEVQVSEMQRRAALAEKEFKAMQMSAREPWWSKFTCHCLHKRPEGTEQPHSDMSRPAREEQLPSCRPPRAAVHMKAANHSGASWLAKPMG